jgi:uncharacterized protein
MFARREYNPLFRLMLVLGYLLLFFLLNALGDVDASRFENLSASTILMMKMVQVISVIVLFVMPAFLFSVYFTPQGINYISFNKRPSINTSLLAIMTMVAVMPVINLMGEWNSHFHLPGVLRGLEDWMKQREDATAELTKVFLVMDDVKGLLLNLFVIAFMAALSEELFFRGVLQRAFFDYSKNIHLSIWTTAVLFSAFHMQFYGFLPRMMIGVLLGYLAVWTRSIWVPIIVHFVNNAVAVIIAYYVAKGAVSPEIETIGADKNALSIIVFSCITGAILIFIVWRKEKAAKAGEIH